MSSERLNRLEEIRNLSLEPFVRATRLESAALYWLPVPAWPPTFRNRQWICSFLNKLIAFAEAEWQVAPLQFLSMNTAGQLLRDTFLRNARTVMPVMGTMARPGRAPVSLPSAEEIDQATKKNATLAPERYTEDYTYWFVRGSHEEQRNLFQAYGGMTILLTEPGETSKIEIPEVPQYVMDHPSMAKFKMMDLKSEVRVVEMMSSDFGEKSKKLFGDPLKDLAIFPSLPFVVPQWSSTTFFDAKPEEIEALFSLCKIYIQESSEDKGLLLAAADDMDEILSKIVQQLKTESEMEYIL